MPPRAGALLFLSCLMLLCYAFHSVAASLYAAWQTEEYSHGLAIPLIAALLGWHVLTERPPTLRPSWWGIAALCTAAFLLLLGDLAAFEAATAYGFIVSLVTLCLCFFGVATLRALAPVFIYLLFMVPLPNLVYSNLSQDLQLISSTIGVTLLDFAGISVYQEGNIIDLGGYRLQVVEACSGLRYLFPLMSFSYLIAYALQDVFWKRAIIFLSAIPITILMNSLRIGAIGITVAHWGMEMAEGLIHQLEGWLVFALCIAVLMAEVWWLVRLGAPGRFRYEWFGQARGPLYHGRLSASAPSLAALMLCVLLAAIFGTGLIQERPEIRPAHPPFASFPAEIGPWRAKPQSLTADELRGLQLTDYWLADYYAKDSSPINLYLAYHASQRVGTSVHTPSRCIPGGGWHIADTEKRTITLHNGQPLHISRLLIKKADVAQLVYFWFEERGRNLTETDEAKWYLFIDSITMQRTDGALIRLVTRVAADEEPGDADARLQKFLQLSYPAIQKFIPGESKTSIVSP